MHLFCEYEAYLGIQIYKDEACNNCVIQKILASISINHGCKEKAFHAVVNTSDSQLDCDFTVLSAVSILARWAKHE